MCQAIDGPYNKMTFSGDHTYAPPEVLYRFHEPEWETRVRATDCFLFGSLVTFYFCGIPMTAMLRRFLRDELSWEQWTGTFEDVIPYLEDAFSTALDEIRASFSDAELGREISTMIGHLCQPNPIRRGHPRNVLDRGSNYSLERFVSKLDLLRRRAEIKILSR